MGGISVLVLLFICLVFIGIEAINIGFLISGIVVAISFTVTKKKENKKIGNKIAVPICLITFGINALIPIVYIIISSFLGW